MGVCHRAFRPPVGKDPDARARAAGVRLRGGRRQGGRGQGSQGTKSGAFHVQSGVKLCGFDSWLGYNVVRPMAQKCGLFLDFFIAEQKSQPSSLF